MSEAHHNILTANRVEIVEDLLVDDVLNLLQSKMVFDLEDVEIIKAESTTRRSTEKLLDLLGTKSDAAFYHFKEALDGPYPHLAELLEEGRGSPRKGSVLTDLHEQGLCHNIIIVITIVVKYPVSQTITIIMVIVIIM